MEASRPVQGTQPPSSGGDSRRCSAGRMGKGTTLGKRADFWKTCGGFSGPHDAPAGRPLLDHTLSALPLRGTSLGRGHSSASALLGHVDRMASVYFALLFAGP